MALQIHTPLSLIPKPYHHLHRRALALPIGSPKFSIKSENPQIESESADGPTTSREARSTGLGFGSSSSSSSTSKRSDSSSASNKGKQKGKRAVIRRSPVENPAFVSREEAAKADEQKKNEDAFVITWLGLGGIILVQGILLAASGFLPEEVDKFFVKYLYPVFTPTVGFFLAGTVAYGVFKYIQNEKLKGQE